jgi:hypothetical protein
MVGAMHSMAERKKGYIYFDNDQEAYAAFDALTIKKLVASAKTVKSRVKM